MGFNELHAAISWVGKLAGRRAQCPLARALPTGAARAGPGRRKPLRKQPRRKITKYFLRQAFADNTLPASFWLFFLHWNNSSLKKTYCIKGF
jgi:hypothetical protein